MGANTYLTERERDILENATVGIAGAGGLGSNLMMHLVRSGVTHFTAADYDRIAESNLNAIDRNVVVDNRQDNAGQTEKQKIPVSLHPLQEGFLLLLRDCFVAQEYTPSVFLQVFLCSGKNPGRMNNSRAERKVHCSSKAEIRACILHCPIEKLSYRKQTKELTGTHVFSDHLSTDLLAVSR